MACTDTSLEQIICAISENGSVRPFDYATLAVSIAGVFVTALIPLALWRIDRRRAARESRRHALEVLCNEIDLIDLEIIAKSSHPDYIFSILRKPALRHYDSSFNRDPGNIGLSAIIHGEFEYAELRMSYCWKSPSEMRQKLNELKGDIRSDLAEWESSSDYRKDISALQKTDPGSYRFQIPYTVNLDTRNGQHPRRAREIRNGIKLIASSFIRAFIIRVLNALLLRLQSLAAILFINRVALTAKSKISSSFRRAVAQAGRR